MVEGKRRGVLCGCLVLTIFFLSLTGAFAQEKGPIKIGLLLPYTGLTPMQAKGLTQGVELAVAEAGGKAGGRTIQIIKEDTELNPTVGLTKARRLLEDHKVNFVIGPVSSAVALAIYDNVIKSNTVWVIPCAFTRELTVPGKANEKMFRTTETSDQGNYPLGKWIVKNTPYRNMVVTGQDYKAGHDSVAAFKAGFQDAGGKIVKEVYTKMGTMDFAPFLTAMDVKGTDAVFAWNSGTDTVRLIQQYQEFGLKKKYPLYGHATTLDDPYLGSIGDAAIGLFSLTHYPPTLDTPRNREFVKAHVAKFKETPSRYSEYGYTAARMVLAGIEATKGDVNDASRVAKEIKRVSNGLEMPSGPLAIDRYNQRIIEAYVVKVEKKEGKLVNGVVAKIGKVAQEDTWNYWLKK